MILYLSSPRQGFLPQKLLDCEKNHCAKVAELADAHV